MSTYHDHERSDDELCDRCHRPLSGPPCSPDCDACGHPGHEMTCHEMVPNGDPSNGPAYCPCAINLEGMEQEIVRLRATLATARGHELAAPALALMQVLYRLQPEVRNRHDFGLVAVDALRELGWQLVRAPR